MVKIMLGVGLFLALTAWMSANDPAIAQAPPPLLLQARPEAGGWKSQFKRRLAAFGHRNWIVVADSAYPAQVSPGVETLVTGEGQIEVLHHVLQELVQAKHVRPVVYLDAELPAVPERFATGIGAYREALKPLVAPFKPQALPHEKIIEKLDKSGQTFKVLILKSTMTLPYTSVFMELDCGYWSPEAEQALRQNLR